MKGKHAQKNFGAFGAMAPTLLSLKTRGGGGGWGVSHTRTGPGRPPVVILGASLLFDNRYFDASSALERGRGHAVHFAV